MSVRANERGESKMEFLNSAFELEKYTMQICHRETAIPKRYRLTIGKSLMDSAKIIHNCVIYANSIYPNKDNDTPEIYKAKVDLRRQYQEKAIREIQIMMKDLRLAYEVLQIKATVFDPWTGLLLKEEKAIKGWRISDKKRFDVDSEKSD